MLAAGNPGKQDSRQREYIHVHSERAHRTDNARRESWEKKRKWQDVSVDRWVVGELIALVIAK